MNKEDIKRGAALLQERNEAEQELTVAVKQNETKEYPKIVFYKLGDNEGFSVYDKDAIQNLWDSHIDFLRTLINRIDEQIEDI